MNNNRSIKSIKVLWIVICGLSLLSMISGCNDFLAENEIPRISSDFYKTKQGVVAASTATYSYMRFGVGGEYANHLTELGTDVTTGAEDGFNSPNNLYSATLSASLARLDNFWVNHYQAIGLTNLVIDALPESSLTENEKMSYTAEMRFFRAFFYFDLVQQFGNIPLNTKAVTTPTTAYKRAPVADVYRLIISDLRFAEENLRDEASGTDKGKATKYAAAHLLAKAYLTRGSAVNDQRGQKNTDMDSAYFYAKRVIDSGKYNLLNNFSDLWNINNMGNREVVFSVQFSTDPIYNGGGNLSHLYWGSWYEDQPGMVRNIANDRPYRHNMVTNKTMFELFDRKNDSRFYKSFKWVYYANSATANGAVAKGIAVGDTAIYHSLNPPKTNRVYKYSYFQWNKENPSRRWFPPVLKHFDPLRATVAQPEGVREWVRMRLGETYLIAAEAAGRKGNWQEAANLINELRKRAAWKDGEAKMPQYWVEEGGEHNNTASTYDKIKVEPNDINTSFVDFMLDERARELLGEYMRWEDLVRCEKLVEYVKKHNPAAAVNIADYHKLRPIPQNHIDRINPKGPPEEEQNPGYF